MRKALVMSFAVAATALVAVVSSGQFAQAGPVNGQAGCWGASPARVRALNKSWKSLSKVSPEKSGVVTGSSAEEAEEAAKPVMADSPILVYVPNLDSGEFCKAEKVVLQDDKVNIGMWAFKCVRMSDEDAKADPMLADGEKLPRFYVIDRDYRKVQVIEGSKMSSKKLFSAMEKSANKAYKQKLKPTVKKMLKILNEYDKINNERKVLKQKLARNGGESDKKMDKAQEEIEERDTKAKEEHKKLLKFELKS